MDSKERYTEACINRLEPGVPAQYIKFALFMHLQALRAVFYVKQSLLFCILGPLLMRTCGTNCAPDASVIFFFNSAFHSRLGV